MDHASNPAGRLWQFLTYTHGSGQRAGLRATWQKCLGAEDDVEYYRAMAEVLALPGQVKSDVRKIADPVPPPAVLLRPLDSILKVLAEDIAGRNTVQWFTQQIGQAHLNDLETCSYVLARHHSDAVIPAGTLDHIRALAEEVVESTLAAADLDDDARDALLRYAHRLIQACDLYWIGGASALRDELDRFLSSALREKVKDRVPTPLWQKVNTVSIAVLTAVQLFTAASDVVGAIETYQGFLELPASVETPSGSDMPGPPTT